MDEIQHRKYLLSYHKQSFYGFWKSILDNPPCKPPNSHRNKQFSYELESIYNGTKHELYLHLIGAPVDLNKIEKQLAKYKIARLEPTKSPEYIILIIDSDPNHGSIHIFQEFCRNKGYHIKGKEIHRGKEDPVLKTYR
ncbi:MAG: hypothetical protein ACFFD2_16185 [Promethearchaeota archaeon]